MVSIFRGHMRDAKDALYAMSNLERYFHLFWLAGPFILLIERSPADLWLSLLAVSFVMRSFALRQGGWLRFAWVRCAFLFWFVSLIAATASSLPVYSIGETLVWFRFPLFGMAVMFWLGRDKRLVYAMLYCVGAGMLIMCGINILELILVQMDVQCRMYYRMET